MDPTREESASAITPPAAVRGMKTLDRNLFSRTVSVPCLKVPVSKIAAASKTLQTALLKMQRVKPVAELSKDDPCYKTHKLFLLNPEQFHSKADFLDKDIKTLNDLDVDLNDLSFCDLDLGYENWPATEILRAVLPTESEGVSSFSIIGHIAHLNLKPEVIEFKHLIGEVLLDKISQVQTVVNKLNTIDNTFRNFQMELLAGEDNFITRAKENGCTFEMDFSKVYWNPRLSTEHQKVVDLLKGGDILFDVFAGIGPFAIPAAKKGVTVHANDLNPNSFSALLQNIKINKVKDGMLHPHNLDGREFIRTVVKKELSALLLSRASEASSDGKTPNSNSVKIFAQDECGQTRIRGEKLNSSRIFITMNLPAMALEFLDAFCSLMTDFPKHCQMDASVLSSLPTVLCYCFSKSQDSESDVRERAEKIMGHQLPAQSIVRLVRNVAPNKEMMVLVFPLTPKMLFNDSVNKDESIGDSSAVDDAQDSVEDGEKPAAKKQRVV